MPPLEQPPAPAADASPQPPPSRRRVIEVAHLRKRYGSTVAVDDVSFDVFEGEIFGLIGPNGAGKTRRSNVSRACGRPTRGAPPCWASIPPVTRTRSSCA